LMQRPGRNEFYPRRQRRLVVGRSRGPDRPLADQDDALDAAHFRRPAHGARQTPPLALDLVAKIDVSIELEDRETSTALEGLKDGDRHGIVAAQDDRRRASIEDGRNGSSDPFAVARRVRFVERQIAAIRRDRFARGEERASEIEIVVRRRRTIGGHRRANGPRRVGAVGADGRIGRRAAGADDGDPSVQRGQVGTCGETEESTRLPATVHTSDVLLSRRHGLSLHEIF